jgi:mono/diheme cytochrome c family protein
MRQVHAYVLGLALVLGPVTSRAGDAQRGAEVLRREKCLICHNIHGEGNHVAPDLGRRIGRRYTPAVMASVLWNHAPTMWTTMACKGLNPPQLSVQDSDDLFAYFYSVRFFDHPGEAERGKRVFEEKRCSGCHSLTDSSKGPGKPVSEWTAFGDPVVLVQQMWTHSGQMTKALTEHKRGWIALTGQDLTDLTVYLQNLPQTRKPTVQFSLLDPASGKDLFESVCAGCHKGNLTLDKRLENATLTDIAADMWNHAPRMTGAPSTGPDEMRRIVAYIWERQVLGPAGNASRGEKVFSAKHCATCHNDSQSGAPKLPGGSLSYSAVTMMSVLWTHGPQMRQEMMKKGISWPNLSPDDISNLAAYLNHKP